MKTFDLSLELPFEPPHTERARELIRIFGLREERIRHQRLIHRCRIEVLAGDIIFITGPSGAGKTVLLDAMADAIDPGDRLRMGDIPLENDRPVIDCFDGAVLSATGTLSRAGLSDVFCLLQTPAALSAGQQFRYRLARAMVHPATYILADEFTSTLDRITAAVTAHHLRQVASRSKKVFLLASSHEDMLRDLLPDILIVKDLLGRSKALYKERKRDPRSKQFWDGRKGIYTIDEALKYGTAGMLVL